MQTVSFSPRFVQVLTLCRYAVYLAIGLLVAMAAQRQGEEIGLEVAYFLIMPLVLHAILTLLQQRVMQIIVYVVEWMCTFALVLFCGLSAIAYLTVTVVFLASNTALWGWRVLPLIAAAGVCVVAVLLTASIALPIYQDALLDGLAAGFGFAYLLVICAIAHAQANQLVHIGSTLKSEKQNLLRYLPKELSVSPRGPRELGVHRVWLTVAFVDLVGFTKATQELPTDALVILLNDFLGSVNALVEKWDGSISKFLGDGVLCVFSSNSPANRRNAAVQAVRCLAQLSEVLCALNQRWHGLGYTQSYSATVGIASGYCCTGSWGSSTRLDYTVIGVPVNLACRLQGAAGDQGGLLLDGVTAALVQDAVTLQAGIQFEAKGIGALQAFPLTTSALSI